VLLFDLVGFGVNQQDVIALKQANQPAQSQEAPLERVLRRPIQHQADLVSDRDGVAIGTPRHHNVVALGVDLLEALGHWQIKAEE
jgi:hypothetical protein